MTEIALATALFTLVILALTVLVMGARRLFVPSAPIVVTVNGKTAIAATTGDRLLAILTGAGIAVPSGCAGAGTCGLCRVRIEGGAGDPLPTERARLDARQIRDGLRLACQVVARDSLSVEVPADMLSAERWDCTVVSNTMLAPLITELVLQLPVDAGFSFRAGSFVQVTAPPYQLDFSAIDVAEPFDAAWRKYGWRGMRARSRDPVSRAYSIANRPQDTDRGLLVLNVRLAVPAPGALDDVPPGVVSSYLFGARTGDRISVSGPFGDFGVREGDREMVLIAGGVGMAPLRAILFDELERKRSDRKISFWFGARSRVEVFYADELSALANRHPNFTWTVALSDPGPGDRWNGAVGFVHEVVFESYLKSHPAPEDSEYYLCGPPLMIQAVMAMLEGLGVDADSIFCDDFGS